MSRFAFAERVRRIERRLVAELGLEPRALPPELAYLEGSFRGERATLEARAYSGPRVGYMRCVEIESCDLDIGNVLALARPERSLPVLGIDLVEVGRDTAVVVADLSPMAEAEGDRARERDVLARHQPPAALPSAASSVHAELPDWAREWFSASALSLRVGADQAEASAAATLAYVTAFIELVRSDSVDTGGVDTAAVVTARTERTALRQRAYCAAHRERDRGLLLLRRMFEPSLADRFLREVLFPVEVPR
ncbi:MAG TPA: hypothetical protein VMG12_35675 [Polyangiaceae bacterium]|nr:hypothetical protein [Polyangiaceae bacterium]